MLISFQAPGGLRLGRLRRSTGKDMLEDCMGHGTIAPLRLLISYESLQLIAHCPVLADPDGRATGRPIAGSLFDSASGWILRDSKAFISTFKGL